MTLATSQDRPKTPQTFFHHVAPHYDRLNFVFSLGQERHWRRMAVRRLTLATGAKVLDAACGTGAMSSALLSARPDLECTGIDQNVDMLRVAMRRPIRARWCLGSVSNLPYDDGEFDASMLAFALDDLENPAQSLRELHRVTRPNARMLALDFGLPEAGPARAAVDAYLGVLQRYGQRLSGARYDHLATEILRAPTTEQRTLLLRDNGWDVVDQGRFMGGVVQMTIARRATIVGSGTGE